jgi:hypothetical protein
MTAVLYDNDRVTMETRSGKRCCSVNAHCCGPAAGTAGGVCVGSSRHLDGETAGRVGAGSA